MIDEFKDMSSEGAQETYSSARLCEATLLYSIQQLYGCSAMSGTPKVLCDGIDGRRWRTEDDGQSNVFHSKLVVNS
jgi:hypothetical protein